MKKEEFCEYELMSSAKTILTHLYNIIENTECKKDIDIIIRKISFLQVKWIAFKNDIDIGIDIGDDEQI